VKPRICIVFKSLVKPTNLFERFAWLECFQFVNGLQQDIGFIFWIDLNFKVATTTRHTLT